MNIQTPDPRGGPQKTKAYTCACQFCAVLPYALVFVVLLFYLPVSGAQLLSLGLVCWQRCTCNARRARVHKTPKTGVGLGPGLN